MHDDIIITEPKKEEKEIILWAEDFVSRGFQLFPVRSSALSIFKREFPYVESAERSRTVNTHSCKMSPKFKHSVLQVSLGTNECDFFFNATLGSLVHPSKLHCIFSNVVSSFKWFEWWTLHLLPGQHHPIVPGFTGPHFLSQPHCGRPEKGVAELTRF